MRARRKNIARRIERGAGRFLAIMFIVALGSGFMAGLAATSPDMLETADAYYDETAWYDLDVKSPLGFTEEDVRLAAEIPGIGTLQCARVVDLVLDEKAASHTCRVYGIFDENGETALNRVLLLDGRMPQAPGECVVQDSAGRYTDKSVAVGDMLTLSPENDRYETLREAIPAETLTVVGIVKSPMSVAVMQEPTNVGAGSIGLHVFTFESYFDLPYYTDLYVSLQGASELDCFGEEYDTLVAEAATQFEALGEDRAPLRARSMREDMQEQIDDLESSAELLRNLSETAAELRDLPSARPYSPPPQKWQHFLDKKSII